MRGSSCHAPVDAGLPAFLDLTAEAGHGLPRSGIRLRRLRKIHRGAAAPSPAGNLPSERYLTRTFLLPATLDEFYCSRFLKKCNRNFSLLPHFSTADSARLGSVGNGPGVFPKFFKKGFTKRPFSCKMSSDRVGPSA